MLTLASISHKQKYSWGWRECQKFSRSLLINQRTGQILYYLTYSAVDRCKKCVSNADSSSCRVVLWALTPDCPARRSPLAEWSSYRSFLWVSTAVELQSGRIISVYHYCVCCNIQVAKSKKVSMALQITTFNRMKEVWQLADFKHCRIRKSSRI